MTDTVSPTPAGAPERLLRIQEVAADTGLTPRAIRYYEELGLLAPAARSDGVIPGSAGSQRMRPCTCSIT